MNEKENKSAPQKDDDERIHVSQSVFQTAREMQQKQLEEMQQKQLELERKHAEREKKKREAYERRLLEEKKELIRLKQGQVEESELIPEDVEEEETKMPLGKKISNFFYHNKWWLGIGVLIAFIGVFLVYDIITKERPDIVVLAVIENEYVGYSEALPDYIESFSEDFNGNDEILASVYYIPFSDSAQTNYANGTSNKLAAEFQGDEAVIVIGDKKITDILVPENIFVNLEELYPDNPNVDGYMFYLKDSGFAEKLNLPEEVVTDDLFIAIRKPQKLIYSSEEEVQETYDKDFPVFDSIIKDLSN